MPADKFNYKPTPEQMTFAHLAAHIANSNNFLCAKAADVPAPKVEEAKDTEGKDKLLAAAKASFDFCSEALGKMDDAKLADSVETLRRAPVSSRHGRHGIGQQLGRPLRGGCHVSAAERNSAAFGATKEVAVRPRCCSVFTVSSYGGRATLPDLDQLRIRRWSRALRRAPRVDHRNLMHARHGAARRAALFRDEFAANVVPCTRQRLAGIAALLRAVVHQAVFADVEITRAGAALPLVLEPCAMLS